MRIGHGYDVHKFGSDQPLVLGGVTIAWHQGLIAHSDGDVVLHALCDALLGALALGDIGKHFPDIDAAFKGADSRGLLRQCVTLMVERGYQLGNLDLTVIAQAPKLRPHIDAMCVLIAADCQCAVEQVNVKATTSEGLGFTGRGEGIAAHAVVLLERRS